MRASLQVMAFTYPIMRGIASPPIPVKDGHPWLGETHGCPAGRNVALSRHCVSSGNSSVPVAADCMHRGYQLLSPTDRSATPASRAQHGTCMTCTASRSPRHSEVSAEAWELCAALGTPCTCTTDTQCAQGNRLCQDMKAISELQRTCERLGFSRCPLWTQESDAAWLHDGGALQQVAGMMRAMQAESSSRRAPRRAELLLRYLCSGRHLRRAKML